MGDRSEKKMYLWAGRQEWIFNDLILKGLTMFLHFLFRNNLIYKIKEFI